MWPHYHQHGCYPPAYTGLFHPHHSHWFGSCVADAMYYACCPVCLQPHNACCCTPKPSMFIPQELAVDTTTPTKDTFVGGSRDAALTMEYMPITGATSPSVTLQVEDSGGTTDWNITSVPDGYHVKSKFAVAAPGAKLTLTANECLARLRWFELIS